MKTAQLERFTHKTGFSDQTHYLEYDHADGVMWLVSKNGTRDRCGYSLRTCRRYVRQGTWRHMDAKEL